MTWVAAAIGGSALLGFIGASGQADASRSAANQQYQATQDAQRQQREMFDIQNAQQAPYREAGYGALTNIKDMLPYFTHQVTQADLENMPGFRFGLDQGVGATKQQLNVGGGGSNIMQGATKFATDYTGTKMADYNAQRTGIYNTLASIAGIGQTGQTQSNQLGSQFAANSANLGIGGASALGAGQIGAANAYAGAGQNIGNSGFLYSMLRPQGQLPSGIGQPSPMGDFGGPTPGIAVA